MTTGTSRTPQTSDAEVGTAAPASGPAAVTEQLAALPEQVQAELAAMVQVLLGMDGPEKRNARELLTTVAAFWTAYGRPIDSTSAELVTALTGLVNAAAAAAAPIRKEAVQ